MIIVKQTSNLSNEVFYVFLWTYMWVVIVNGLVELNDFKLLNIKNVLSGMVVRTAILYYLVMCIEL